MPGDEAIFPRWALRIVAALGAVAIGYAFYRGAVVSLDYFDGYQYLLGARRMSGDAALGGVSLVRPPFLSLADVPALALARLGAPANVIYRVGPHLTAALLSTLAALAVYFAFRASQNARLALLGVVWLITGRLFIRYGALTMADLASMGWAALAVGLHARTLQRSTWARDLLCGLAVGLGGATKYPLLSLGAALLLGELATALSRRRLSARRIAGFALTGLVAIATFCAVLALAQGLGNGWRQLSALPLAIREALDTLLAATHPLPGERRWHDAVLIAATTAWPVLALAVAGIVVAIRDRQERDLPFAAWLVGFGGIFVATVAHSEARYLLPLVPPLLYFAGRAVAALSARLSSRAAGWAVVAVALLSSGGGLQQAWADADPVFRSDLHRRAAAALLQTRRPGGHLRWGGGFACLTPLRRIPLPHDEFFDTFHFHGPAFSVFLGEPAEQIASLGAVFDGDALLVAGSPCGQGRPPHPWTVSAIRRQAMRPVGSTFVLDDPPLVVEPIGGSAGVVLLVRRGVPPVPGRDRILVISDPAPRLAGRVDLTPGRELWTGLRDASTLRGLELLEITDTVLAGR